MANGHAAVSLCIIGTEITRGIISDKHGNLIARELTNLGYEVNRIVIVPDDGSLGPIMGQVVQETDIVLLTGGLGPTSDDMTRQVVADLAGVPLVQDEVAFQELFERIGNRIYGANQKQVTFPAGFRVIPNPKGTAPGFSGIIPVQNRDDSSFHEVLCYAMPGPPVEMHEMFYNRVLPELAHKIGKNSIGRDEYSCFLTPESKLEELCADCARDSILWGTRVQEHRISLYLNGGTAASRAAMAKEIGEKLGTGLLVAGNVEVVDLLRDYLTGQGKMMVSAESCTGGLISKLMTDQAGSSAWFWGSVVSYANLAKVGLLGVPSETIEHYGAVSAETVSAMATGMLTQSQVDLSIAVSGIAGPDGGTTDKPVGTVWFGFAEKGKESTAIKLVFSSYGRASVRRRAAVGAILLGYFYANGSDLLDIVRTWQYI